MKKAELFDVYEKEVTVLILENSRLKEALTKEKEAATILKENLEAVSSQRNTLGILLLVLVLVIIAYVVFKIRFR